MYGLVVKVTHLSDKIVRGLVHLAWAVCGKSNKTSRAAFEQESGIEQVEGGRVRASGASTRRKAPSPQEQASGQNSAVPGPRPPVRHCTLMAHCQGSPVSLLNIAAQDMECPPCTGQSRGNVTLGEMEYASITGLQVMGAFEVAAGLILRGLLLCRA